jgi:hypothetical protein
LRRPVLALHLMTQLEKFSHALRAYTDLVQTKVLRDIRHQQNTLGTEPYQYYYTVLHKLNSGLDACAFLMQGLEKRRHFSDSVFLAIRALISDTMIFYHIVNKSGGDKEKMKPLIKSLYYDHFEYAFKEPALVAAARGVTVPEVEAEIHDLKMDNPDYFNPDGTSCIAPWKTTVRGALKFALSNPIDADLRQCMQAQFGYYELLSKYEHFGFLTFNLTHRHERAEELKKVPFQIMDSILSLIPTCHHVIALWPDVKRRYVQSIMDHIGELLYIFKNTPSRPV